MEKQDNEQAWLENIRTDEELGNVRKIKEWLLPLLKKLLRKQSLEDVTILSVGCGFGADVDTLVDIGVKAYGVEPFARTKTWHLRRNKGRLIIADGRNMPFKDQVFDVVYSAEVLEHVGYEGQSNTDANRVQQEREKFAHELTRVLKPKGIIVTTTPNRHCCIDIGHGANFWGLRVHSPFNDFTPSLKDIKSLFLQKCGCSAIATLPYRNFITWDLYINQYPIIRLFHPVIKTYLALLDRLKFLRASFLSPYLILAIKK